MFPALLLVFLVARFALAPWWGWGCGWGYGGAWGWGYASAPPPDAREDLRERLARGEIGEDEYLKRLREVAK
jgi:hypothetical protein